MNIVVIGGGNMGLTYALSIHKNFENATISILERGDEKIERLRKTTGFAVYNTPEACIPKADIILLAIKPQVALLVFKNIQPLVNKNQIVISIMAGVTLETITTGLNIDKVVRAMPNLPSQVGKGVTGFFATTEFKPNEINQVKEILSATGYVIQVPNENAIDAITALSGSGPAYVFYFMNAMMEKATELGFSEADAKEVVVNTFLGTAELFKNSTINAQTWIDRVTSKGGTTHAALTSFRDNNIDSDIQNGVQAAFDRAKELGKN